MQFKEIKNNFINEKGEICIDAYKTLGDNEEGKTIAKVGKNGEIEYLDDRVKTDKYAQEVIKNTQLQIQNKRVKTLLYNALVIVCVEWTSSYLDADEIEKEMYEGLGTSQNELKELGLVMKNGNIEISE